MGGMDMKLKIFGKNGCAKCETTKNKLNFFVSKWGIADKVKVDFHDMDTCEGRAEGAYHDVVSIPTTIFEKDAAVLARWDGVVPNSEEVKSYIATEEVASSE